MSDTTMSVLLIGISGILLSAILGWDLVKRITGINSHSRPKNNSLQRLKGIHNFYKIVLVLFIISSCGYLLMPELRVYAGPLQLLDTDYINITGFIVLVIAFILIIKTQLKLDRQFYLYYSDPGQQANSRIVPDTEKQLLGNILLVYAGMFIVVSTIVNVVLLIIALFGWYSHNANRKFKTPTQVD